MADPDDDKKLGGFALSTLVVYGVLLAATIPVLLRRRHLQPLKFRDPSLLISTIAFTYLANISSALSVYITFPYCILQVLNQMPFSFMISLIMARFWKLFLASRVTSARLYRNGHDWILRYPWMASTRNIWRGVLALGTVLALVQLVVAMSADACIWSDRYWASSSVMLTLYWITMAIMTWKLRGVEDGLFIVTELRMLGLVVLLTNALVIVLFQPDVGLGASFGPGFVAVSSLLQMVIQTWYPLWKSYQMAQTQLDVENTAGGSFASTRTESKVTPSSWTRLRNQAPSALTKESEFIDILRHPDGYEAMKRFLTLEFSVENLLCWKQLHEHKQERRKEQIEAHFRAIYENFIRKGCLNEVNINAELKKHFSDVYKERPVNHEAIMKMKQPKCDHTFTPDQGTDIKLRLLKQLYREMIRLMKMDSFQRFKQTALYDNLFQAGADHRTVMDRS